MKSIIKTFFLLIMTISCNENSNSNSSNNDTHNGDLTSILSYTVNLKNQTLKFYWKDKNGDKLINFKNLKNMLLSQNKELIFAMNGGMYNPSFWPVGLYIENGI